MKIENATLKRCGKSLTVTCEKRKVCMWTEIQHKLLLVLDLTRYAKDVLLSRAGVDGIFTFLYIAQIVCNLFFITFGLI